MNWLGRIALFIVFSLAGYATTSAQDEALRIGSVVEGNLAAAEKHYFTLNALALTLLSFRVEAIDDQLDPMLEVFDSTGKLIISNDDYGYPDGKDAIIQAFVMPRTDTYTIAISAFGETHGDYRLHTLPGYDVLELRDTVMEPSNWELAFADAIVDLGDSSLFSASIQGLGRSAIVVGLHYPLVQEGYFEAEFDSVGSSGEWKVGLAFRYLSPNQYHRLLLSKSGYWRVERIDGDTVTQLRNWSTHPAIIAGERSFRLGILISGQHYDVVYNGQVVGSISDAMPLPPGTVGIAMQTDSAIGGSLAFVVRESSMTVPTRVDERILFPSWLLEGRYRGMADVLMRQQLVPVGGEIKLALPESTVRHVKSGVTRLPIASDLSFAEFAIGASLGYELGEDANGGCGIFFHNYGESNYTLAYMTHEGDYGVSRRMGDVFEPGIYGSRELEPRDDSHYILVIVTQEMLHYYLDERYVGSMDYPRQVGGVGIAVVNYDEVDATCNFKDLWLLSLDS